MPEKPSWSCPTWPLSYFNHNVVVSDNLTSLFPQLILIYNNINPPFNCEVRTRIAYRFFEALERNFPVKHKYHRILNKHTVKLSYSTTHNLGQIIDGSNKRKDNGVNSGGRVSKINIDDDVGGENNFLKINDAVSFSSALSNREKLK